jgi:serine/threonine-protein kinase
VSPKRAAASDWTGKTLYGKWTVERLIGVGGTSTVLQARHRNGRRAALKILHAHLAAHGRTRERFLREGRLANLVNHPGVVAVLDDFTTDDGTAVLVLELVLGQTLAAAAKESGGVLTAREVVAAACAVLEILAVAHDASIVHRDIKPENILRCADGTHRLADFGLAALQHELGMLTGTNVALGTPAYMSPEQARGNALEVDARTDIFGLGATMFTLLTGRYLHATSASRNLVVAAATEAIPPILSLEPAMFPPLAAIIERAVTSDKERRWPNARAMLAELSGIEAPDSGIRPVESPANVQGATMSTAPSSALSWSRARDWLGRTESDAKWWGGRVAWGVAAAAGIALAFWGGRSRTDDQSPGRTSSPFVVRAARALASTPAPPPSPSTATPLAPSPHIRSTPPSSSPERVKRPPRAKRYAAAEASAEVPPSPPPRAPVVVAEPELAVPDDVLDRRE